MLYFYGLSVYVWIHIFKTGKLCSLSLLFFFFVVWQYPNKLKIWIMWEINNFGGAKPDLRVSNKSTEFQFFRKINSSVHFPSPKTYSFSGNLSALREIESNFHANFLSVAENFPDRHGYAPNKIRTWALLLKYINSSTWIIHTDCFRK